MLSDLPLALHTAYAELLERCASADFTDASAEDGVFTPKTVRERRYWYFQDSKTRRQRYVGPESTELLERIAHHRQTRDDLRERQALVSTLVRSARLPRPEAPVGDVLHALAQAGVFRLRSVLVGTVAFQTYPAMLGARLVGSAIQTGDLDIAQDRNISVAVHDATPPMLDLLRKANPSFRPVPHRHGSRQPVSYSARDLRVDFLTPNRGADTDAPAHLPALGTDAQQLRFLDYLIRDPEPAVVLHGAGIYVQVPAPPRYALHKLIISRRRQSGTAKRDKDVRQAEMLLEVLIRKRTGELQPAWDDVFNRGKTWRQLLIEGLALIDPSVRDGTLGSVKLPRSTIADLDLSFDDPPGRYDSERDVVLFTAKSGVHRVSCAISREALEDHFEAGSVDKEGRIRKFREHRRAIEEITRLKYLEWPIESVGEVLIKTGDVPELKARLTEARPRARRRKV